ncbi:cytochrome ubiquinol oxidase subunit I [Herpetosiphon giganteus]|uniref:cytochrome ubiquinol oxidase subunit I n=1 Tax=Herpetosiphon giganteus TaxID=2029754 RepID=UPI00195DB71D|nr:cytochrome ubiquinol oxidase subunit I [Herpetosiphon giganteus]MBM7844338.1 cytochrome d ubiquinol oxidase subunit I [Herpetosiphon giganteus]
MDTLTAARAQMEVSLAFHMVFAALGIGFPLLMVISEGLGLKTGQAHYLALAKKWAKATALTFAIGAVSGTALAFELGLLWPTFMGFAGSIIGSAFTLEGFAFFIEAIFLGLYLYGWKRLSPLAHWLTGIPVAISGMLSGALVVAANAWMQTPVGFDLVDGKAVNVNPLAPFLSPAWLDMALHSTLSCYIATGFAVAGVYAMGMLKGRNDRYHRSALTISLGLATVTALLQPISGHISAQRVAKDQPAKLAAMEALFETQAGAPLLIGGIPDPETGEIHFGIEIPKALSFMATNDFNAELRGLNSFPPDERPNVVIAHIAFQVMVGAGFALIGLGLWFWWRRWRGNLVLSRKLLWALVIGSPLGFLALQAGWIVTEVGRQPWIIYEVMRTRDAVTTVDGVPQVFYLFSLLYIGLASVLVYLLRKLATGYPPEANESEATNAA